MPPVEDHPVHPSTQTGSDWRYGCFDSEPAKHGYLAKDGVIIDTIKTPADGVINVARYRMKYVEHAMSTNCRHPEYRTDPGCRGCNSQRDDEFIALYWKRHDEEMRQILQNTMRTS